MINTLQAIIALTPFGVLIVNKLKNVLIQKD